MGGERVSRCAVYDCGCMPSCQKPRADGGFTDLFGMKMGRARAANGRGCHGNGFSKS